MAFKASNYLPSIFVFAFFSTSACAWAATSLDTDISDALQKKDWPAVILLLEPKVGQNFEHDLTLARALLSLERRQEALALLATLSATHKDDRVTRLIQSAGTLFFTQEVSNLYYESLELIRALKFQEAKEHLEQGLSKEPGQLLLLTRLIQMQLVLKQSEAANTNLKIAQATSLGDPELKRFAAKISTEKKPDADSDVEKNEAALYRELNPIRQSLLENEVTLPFWGEALRRIERTSDLEALTLRTMKEHPLWTHSLLWLYRNAFLKPAVKEKVGIQIEKNLKSKDIFLSNLDKEMKDTDYFWVGYVSYESLQSEYVLASATPKPSPTVAPETK